MGKRQLRERPFFPDLLCDAARHALGRANDQHEMRHAAIHPLLQLLGQLLRGTLPTLYKKAYNAARLEKTSGKPLVVLPVFDRAEFYRGMAREPFDILGLSRFDIGISIFLKRND